MLNLERIAVKDLTFHSEVQGVTVYTSSCEEVMLLGGLTACRLSGGNGDDVYGYINILTTPTIGEFEDVVIIHTSMELVYGQELLDFMINHEVAHIELKHVERFFDVPSEDRLDVAYVDHGQNELDADALAFTRVSSKASHGMVGVLKSKLDPMSPFNQSVIDRIAQLETLLKV